MRFIRSCGLMVASLVMFALVASPMASADPPPKPNCGDTIQAVFIKGTKKSTSFRIVGTNLGVWFGAGGGTLHTYVNAPGMEQKHFQTGAGRDGASSGLITVTTARENIDLYVMLNNYNNDTLCTKSMRV